jgi:hypothetical protein
MDKQRFLWHLVNKIDSLETWMNQEKVESVRKEIKATINQIKFLLWQVRDGDFDIGKDASGCGCCMPDNKSDFLDAFDKLS